MVLDELDDERGLACVRWRVGVKRKGSARRGWRLEGRDAPTEREPRTAILRFLSNSPGMMAAGVLDRGRRREEAWGYYKGVGGGI